MAMTLNYIKCDNCQCHKLLLNNNIRSSNTENVVIIKIY